VPSFLKTKQALTVKDEEKTSLRNVGNLQQHCRGNLKLTVINIFFMVKGPAADATDATQPKGLLCNPVMKMNSLFTFPSNGAPVE
jgi:hypothetical protein